MDGSNSPFGSEDNTSLLFSNDHPTVLPATVYEILYNIGQTFSHVQYAITGTAAMMAYGFDDRAPQHISIICPSRSKEVIPSWAAAGGMETSLIEPNIINVTVTGGDVWKIRVLYLDLVEDGFDAFETVHMSFGDDSMPTAKPEHAGPDTNKNAAATLVASASARTTWRVSEQALWFPK
ncbi:hypothetical protein Cob_v010914 [Colletotrichum orbiculare MAFF 240422]|uniref:Uncharacterized protein n=1 Tax=Colletotrichum orbiculare (strain 104-T / ATCC 96160 / CBS 514.97 / LARS 414 / MAFF 240422) TaxID=1213857 RepID=A0A484FDP6_COLOR|nr:hypothetical protein Cob_v010914 [Colletotrichum orbiculare MAFF 240422]